MRTPNTKSASNGRATKASLAAQVVSLQSTMALLSSELSQAKSDLGALTLERASLLSRLNVAERNAQETERHHKNLHVEIERLKTGSKASEEAYKNALAIVTNRNASAEVPLSGRGLLSAMFENPGIAEALEELQTLRLTGRGEFV